MPFICQNCKKYALNGTFTCPICGKQSLYDFHTEKELRAKGLRLISEGNKVGMWDFQENYCTTGNTDYSHDKTGQPFFESGVKGQETQKRQNEADKAGSFFSIGTTEISDVEPVARSNPQLQNAYYSQLKKGSRVANIQELLQRARHIGVFRYLVYIVLVLLICSGIMWLWSRRNAILNNALSFIGGLLPLAIGVWILWVCVRNLINPK